MPTSSVKLKLPQLRAVKLQRFSLYAANPSAEFSCSNGVLCLIGANGLGKSTLLSAINFGFTGIVADPDRKFSSMEEYYTNSKRYSASYFRGRISEEDSDEAEITLVFVFEKVSYEIRRGLFEPDELRGLTITRIRDGVVELDTSDSTRRERQELYEARLLSDIGLSSFSEYVFLQLFVFTFDERRMTLFWNQEILERALYLAFGLDVNTAKKVDTLKRDHDSADSQVRNRQFDATRMRKRVNELREQFQSSSATQQNYESLAREQEKLTKIFETDLSALEMIRAQLKDANLRLATLSSRDSGLRDEYAKFFEKGMKRRPPLAQQPLFTHSLSAHCCELCGNSSNTAVQTIKRKVASDKCPICESTFSTAQTSPDDIERLRKLDKEIAQCKKDIQEVLQLLTRLHKEEASSETKFQAIKDKLKEFEDANEATMLSLRQAMTQNGGVDALLISYRAQLEKLLSEKKTAETRRSNIKKELANAQKELQRQYFALEKDFVPSFTSLAYHFIGMAIEIKLASSEVSGVSLVIELRGKTRHSPHHLSESQRFFLDIALRMALTQFISDKKAKGALFIDTPEGSLDIAYEKRAGEMLAKFVQTGHPILMTANLNSSKLLLALARSCGRDGLQICRMTDWAELSEVQQEEEGLFEDAYSAIEAAFEKK